MEYVFSDLLGRCEVELSGADLRIASTPLFGSTRTESHSVATIWPVQGHLPLSAWLRFLFVLPGCLVLIAALAQGYNLYKTSLGLYILALLLAFGIVCFGAWLGSELRFCTLRLRNGPAVLRIIGTPKNQAMMAALIEGLKRLSAKEPEANTGHDQPFWVPEDLPQWLSASYTGLAEDRATSRQFAARAPKSPDAAPVLPVLFLFYWLACAAAWILFDKYVRGHEPDIGSVLAGMFAFCMAAWLVTLHGKRRTKSQQTAAAVSTVQDSSVHLTPEAIVCNYPSYSIALRWKDAKQLLLEESGIVVFHSWGMVFIPARAFMDANHRNRFVNGIISLAPHLNAQINFAELTQEPALENK